MERDKKVEQNNEKSEITSEPIDEFNETQPAKTLDNELHDDVSRETYKEGGIYIEYDLKNDEVVKGMRLFQKNTIYKKNIIYTIILAVVFVVFVVEGIIYNQISDKIILLSILLAVIFLIWYYPLSHIKRTAQIISEEKLPFSMTIYDDCFCVKTENDIQTYFYSDKEVKRYILDDIIVFGIGKHKLYILPKRCLGENLSKIISIIERKA